MNQIHKELKKLTATPRTSTPRTLDEALRIALRLEAWAKNAKQEKQEEERIERSRNKVRTTTAPGLAKVSEQPGSDDRLTKLENQMNQIHQELNKLTATPRTSTFPPRTQQNVSNFSVQRPDGNPGNLFGRGNVSTSIFETEN